MTTTLEALVQAIEAQASLAREQTHLLRLLVSELQALSTRADRLEAAVVHLPKS